MSKLQGSRHVLIHGAKSPKYFSTNLVGLVLSLIKLQPTVSISAN